MKTRRIFLTGTLATLAFGTAARANPRCIADPKRGGQLCKTFIDVTDAFQETYHARHEPAAIWIACVAVVFASQGHVIQQPRIAEEAYGGFANVPIKAGFAVAEPLVRSWKDDDGVAFRASVEPIFNLDAAPAAFDQDSFIQALSAGDPVILGGGGHPVVLTALAYAQGNAPRRLVAGFVFDPMPLVGPRALDIDELVPQNAGGDLRFAVRTRLEKI
jgi:hypothetical protein